MRFQPAIGDQFLLPGRRDLPTIAQIIAAFTSERAGESLYLVESAAGARWTLAENPADDGPKRVGRAVPGETHEE